MKMNKLNKDIGIIYDFEDGYLLEHKQVGKVQPEFLPCVEIIKQKIEEANLNVSSVYITGAVAKGTAFKNVSDLDLAFIYEDQDFDKQLLYRLWSELMEIVPRFGLTHLDCKYLMKEEVMASDPLKFILKYQGFCVYGDPFTKRMEKSKLSSVYMFKYMIFDQFKDLKANRNQFFSDPVLIKHCRSIMKVILRTSIELVMEKEEKYTDDLYPCYQFFSKHYPKEQAKMKEVLDLALNPTSDKDVIFEKIDWAENFFADKFPLKEEPHVVVI